MRLCLLFIVEWAMNQLRRRLVPATLIAARDRHGVPGDAIAAKLLQIVILVVSVFASNNVPFFFVVFGLFLYATGQTLVICAARENPYFLPVIVAPPVVIRTGVYRRLRHPGYTGHLVSASGIWLVWQSLPALVPLALFAGLLVWRAKREDALIHALIQWKPASFS